MTLTNEMFIAGLVAAVSFVCGMLLQAFVCSRLARDARMGCYRIEGFEPLSSNARVFVVQRFRPTWFLPSGWRQVGPEFSNRSEAEDWWKCLVKGNLIVIDAMEDEEAALPPIDKGLGVGD